MAREIDPNERAERFVSNAANGADISEDFNKLSEDERRAVFERMTAGGRGSATVGDLVITGLDTDNDRKPDTLGDVWNRRTRADLYNRPGEQSNSDAAVQQRFNEVLNNDRDFMRRFNGFNYDPRTQESRLDERAPAQMRREAVARMVSEHGVDRVKETFKALEEMGGSSPYFYKHDLRLGYPPTQEDFDRRMGNLSRLMEPGNLERAREITALLSSEQYSKKMSLDDLSNPELVQTLLTNPTERAAYRELNETASMGGYHRLANQYGDRLREMPPTQQLAELRRHEREIEQEKVERERPWLEEIQKSGRPPRDMLTEAMRENRVLVMGEQHDEQSPHRERSQAIIRDLKESGATHFAVELQQEVLDEFQRTGDINTLPPGVRHQNYVNLLQEARDAGLQLVATDTVADEQGRDNHMADRIDDVLRESPNNKVVFWVGALHGATTADQGPRSAADLLRERNHSVATVFEQSPVSAFDPLARMSGIEQDVAIRTRETPTIAQLEPTRIGNQITERYGMWDIVVIYPRR